MNRRTRLYAAVALLALFLAGCSGPCDKLDPVRPGVRAGDADFSTYVALGTSISAGYQSGGLVETHQAFAFPTLFARQARVASFTYDRVSPDGYNPLLRLVSLSPQVVINNAGRETGYPRDSAQATAFHNLGVPGAILFDCTSPARYGANPFFGRFVTRGRGTVLQEAASLAPTFVSIEYGANEVLGSALAGTGQVPVSVDQFAGLLAGTLVAIQGAMPGVKMALFTVPDVTTIPYVTTVKPFVVLGGQTVWLTAQSGELTADDFVLLPAGALVPTGVGLPGHDPLPDNLVLTGTEAQNLRNVVDGYNQAITLAAQAHGAALVDLHGLLQGLATHGYDFGGTHFSSAFVSGGLFSLDGIHPTDFAHGLIANRMIDAVNARFGATVPHVNLGEVETASSSAARPATGDGAGGPPRVEGLLQALAPLMQR